MKFIKLIFILISMIVLSCDCMQNVSGTILDSETKEPIDGVFVKKISRSNGEYTDSNGNFELMYTDGGLFKCPPMKIIINKKGYNQKIEEIENSESKIILIERIK